MAVLVTGAGGFVGRVVVRRLRSAGHDVLTIPRRWHTSEELGRAIGRRSVERCIHVGWYAHPADYLTNASENIASLNNSIELFQRVVDAGCRHFLGVGTVAELKVQDRPLDEAAEVGPWSMYGAAKAAAHLILNSSLRPEGVEVGWARLFNVTGAGEGNSRLIPMVTTALLQRRPFDLSPGEQVRDYLDVEDVAEALVALSTVDRPGCVHVCSGVGTRLRDLLLLIAERLDAPSELLRFGGRPYGSRDPMVVLGDSTVLRSIGWQPRHSVDAIADRVAAYWSAVRRRNPLGQ